MNAFLAATILGTFASFSLAVYGIADGIVNMPSETETHEKAFLASSHPDVTRSEYDAPANDSQWTVETTIAAPTSLAIRVSTSSLVWVCDAPRTLENDATQTVRECAWVSR